MDALNSPRRLHEIDGIRGWAAVVVLVFHLCKELFGGVVQAFRDPLLTFMLDGHLAVFVFFVLSGDALSSAYISSRDTYSLARMALKRYFRLAGPILMSCALVYVLMKAGLTYHREASQIVSSESWLGRFLPFEPNFVHLVKYGLLWVFTSHELSSSYNPFLWPMSIELYGSFFVFALLLSLNYLKHPIAIAVGTFLFFWILGSYFALFFFGLTLALLRETGFFDRIRSKKYHLTSILGLTIIAIVDTTFDAWHLRGPTSFTLLACSLVFLIYSSSSLVSFFSSRFSRYLGRISFPLYVTHFAVIVSFSSWAIVQTSSDGILSHSQTLIIIGTSIFVSIVIAEIFCRIEASYLRHLSRFIDLGLSPTTIRQSSNSSPSVNGG